MVTKIMSKNLLLIFIFSQLLIGCANYTLPKNKTANNNYNVNQIKRNLLGYDYVNSRISNVNDMLTPENPKAGSNNFYGVLVTRPLEKAFEYYLMGDAESALLELNKIDNAKNDNGVVWQKIILKIKTLILIGKGNDALKLMATCDNYESLYFGSNLNCRALRGELYVWLEQYSKAKSDFLSILQAVGKWELPNNYIAIPSNMSGLVHTATAQIRSMVGLSAVYYFEKSYDKSYYWAKEGEKRINTVLSIIHSPLYGGFIKPHMDIYYGAGLTLALVASGKLLIENNEFESEKLYKEAKSYFQKIGLKRGEAIVPTLQAFTYLKSGKGKKLLQKVDEALDIVNHYGFLDLSWRIEVEKGRYFFNLGNKGEAEKSFRNAQKTISYISNSLASDNSKVNFGVGKEDITKYLIQIDISKNDYAQLFSDLEEGRSRAFLDIFRGSVIRDQNNPILSSINEIDEKILKLTVKAGSKGSDNSILDKVRLLRVERRVKLIELKINFSRIASAVAIWSGDIKDFQNNLGKDENALYYFNENNKLSYLNITKDSIKLIRLKVSPNVLQEDLNLLYGFISNSDKQNKTRGLRKINIANSVAMSKTTFLEQKNKVYSELGLKNVLMSKTYIIPSSTVNFVPWGVLDIDKPISVLTSASLLSFPKELIKMKSNAVIVGNPNFGGHLPQLPGAENEALNIASLYDKKALVYDDATLKKLYSSIGTGTKVLHLATHGIFDNKDPLASSIYLSKNGSFDKVTAKDIFEKPLKSYLVVLSACETGLGKSISGDDFLGLTRTFFLGGSNAVLSTLWEVDDDGTKEFMKEFHRYAKNGDYMEGYHLAKKKLKDAGYPPSIYGAFVLYGKNLN